MNISNKLIKNKDEVSIIANSLIWELLKFKLDKKSMLRISADTKFWNILIIVNL